MNLVARTALLPLTPLTRWAQEYVRTTLARRSGRASEAGTLRVPLVAQHRG